jgi:hypothetical protein
VKRGGGGQQLPPTATTLTKGAGCTTPSRTTPSRTTPGRTTPGRTAGHTQLHARAYSCDSSEEASAFDLPSPGGGGGGGGGYSTGGPGAGRRGHGHGQANPIDRRSSRESYQEDEESIVTFGLVEYDDLNIIKEVAKGSYGIVSEAQWRNYRVAVKMLFDQRTLVEASEPPVTVRLTPLPTAAEGSARLFVLRVPIVCAWLLGCALLLLVSET